MKSIFGNAGYLSNVIPSYEFRKEQLLMADFILERLVESENGLIEAGTGTGKTLAYLLPTILYAIEQEKKVAITTETKALQKQLLGKDIPIVKKILNDHYDMDFTYSLCLGGANYPCRKRYEIAVKSGKFPTGALNKLEPVEMLFNKKKVFTRLDVSVPGYIWNEINREGDSCSSFKCPYSGVCSYQLARREWSQANILVMNHYLFFTNIASGKTYLPPFDIAVFDEAHSIEEIAASQIGFNLGYNELLDLVNLFFNDRKSGILKQIKNEKIAAAGIELMKKINPVITGYFEKIRSLSSPQKNYMRLREPVPFGNEPVSLLKEFMLLMADADQEFDEDDPGRMEFDIARGRLFTSLENLNSFVFQNNDNYVYWIERESDAVLGDLYLRGQPVNIAEIFNREIIACYDSSIFVSATLAVNEDFSYIVERLGIENHRALPLRSSFDYRSQVVLYVARDIVDPGNESYNLQASNEAAEIINHLQGNCLALFTSYRTLREVKTILADLIDYPIYSQDVLTPSDAFEKYVGDNNSVLLGTHSFWQGIDLPGDLVRGVLLMKLPFAVPDSPPVEAKMERCAGAGKNPFMSIQVPEAVIRFKQGFGRLIRSSADRGVVAVLDSRIMSKSYGRIFLKSIPECRVVYSLRDLKNEYTSMQVSEPARFIPSD